MFKNNKQKDVFLLIASLLLSYGVMWSASYFTQSSVGSWYVTLNKPSWTPPKVVFPIAWSALYTMIGVAFWLVIRQPKACNKEVLLTFFAQMLLNFLWSFSFFYLQSPFLGLVNILLLLVAICWNAYLFSLYSKWAGRLLVPYLLWVFYAATLNFSIWVTN